MITEDYVSFETAKLLKEKGFDERCEFWFAKRTSYWGGDSSGDRTYIVEYHGTINHHIDDSCEFLCYKPTLQRAMKWLRKVHNLFIMDDICFNDDREREPGYVFDIWQAKPPYELLYYLKEQVYDSPEEACEAAIKYCLENLI